jgi:hypothetical protein
METPEKNTPDNAIPTVQKKAPPPPGILPRNAQAWFIGGISFVMVVVIALSGGKEPKRSSQPPPSPATDPSQERIQEYRARIEEQARRLAAEQAQLALTKQAAGISPNASGVPPAAPYPTQANPAYSPPPEKSWIEIDREKRNYQSLFASNVALSYRSEAKTPERVTMTAGSVQTK